jgi:glycosyltransferase involved in cell wall biosynthesis
MVVPSIWYENYPLSVLEPKALGKVVIASRIGGIKEMLPKELLVKPEDPKKLAEMIKHWYLAKDSQRLKMGNLLRTEAKIVNDPVLHTKEILSLYKNLVK